MSISDKLSHLEHLQPIFWKMRSWILIHRVDVDLTFAADYETEIHRRPVYQNEINFAVWDAAGFDYIFDRRSFGQLSLDLRAFRFQKEWQIAVKRQLDHERRHRPTRAVE